MIKRNLHLPDIRPIDGGYYITAQTRNHVCYELVEKMTGKLAIFETEAEAVKQWTERISNKYSWKH